MENYDNKNTITASAVIAEVAVAEDEAVVAVATAESFPTAYASVATATPIASIPKNNVASLANDDDGDDLKAKYAMYDYSHDDKYVVHEALTGVASVASATTSKIPHNTPYTTPYDPEMERRIAEEATRRGHMLSEQEIQDIRRVNYKANAINNQEQLKVALANQNAMYQNYKEETGLTQTSSTIPYEAVAIPTSTTATREPEYFPGGTYGKGGYEISDYETSTYETTDYKFTEYKSVYDP
jgi:hypothetical protein